DDLVAPGSFPLQSSFDQYLPPDGALHLQVSGTSRQCIDTVFGKAIKTDLKELMFQGTVDCLETFNQPHDPGSIEMTWKGPDFGASGGAAPLTLDGAGPSGGFCADDA